MLDVHPPHHPTHTWKDFFIHIATIVIGLIIAVGLEQSVEALHRRHERTELRASLRRELEQLDYDASHEDEDAEVHTAWLNQIEAAIETSARTEQPLGTLSPPPPGKADDRENPYYRAAKASGRLTLLNDDEIAAYGEVDNLVEQGIVGSQKLRDDYAEMIIAERHLQQPLDRDPGDKALLTGLAQLQDRVMRLQISVSQSQTNAHFLRGAAKAMLRGEANLKRIEAAER
jgi:hypothetical protein